MEKLKKHKKETNTMFVNTLVLTVLVKMFGFSAFFVLRFSGFPLFWEMFWIGSQNSKNNKTSKQQKQKSTTTRKQDAKENI